MTDAVVSHHPLTMATRRKEVLAAVLGAVELAGLALALTLILKRRLSLEGDFTVAGLDLPVILAIPYVTAAIYAHQKLISLLRPTGEKAGFWYGLLDFVPSAVVFVIALVIVADVVAWAAVSVFDFSDAFRLLSRAQGQYYAAYNATSFVAGLTVMWYSFRDLRYNHWLRADIGREKIIAREVEATVPPDRVVLIVDKARVPHGCAVYARKSTGGVDFDGGALSILN